MQLNPQLCPTGFGDVGSDLTAQAQADMNATVAQGQQQLNKLQGQAAVTWNASQTQTANSLRIANGAKAAESLLQNGYDPNNDVDNQTAITAVAGGLSLIPGVGIILGGALLILDAIAIGIAKGLEAIGLIPKPGCYNTVGTWTPANVLGVTYPNGIPFPQGTFAYLAIAALTKTVTDRLNCQPVYPNSWIVAAVQSLWNAGTVGHNVTKVWVPYLDLDGMPFFKAGSGFSQATISPETMAQYAFQTVDNVPQYLQQFGQTIDVNEGPYSPPVSFGDGGIISLQPSPVATQKSAPMSTGAKVAIGTAVAVGGTAAGIGIYAWLKNKAYSEVASQLWKQTGGRLFKR